MPIPADVLLSLLSHELRAPLGVVRGYLRLLEQAGGLDERQAKAVAGGAAGGDRLAEVLDQASELGRLMRDELRLDRDAVAVDALLGDAAAAAVLPSDPVVTLDVRPAPRLSVSVDRPRLARALGTLVTALARAQAAAVAIRLAAEGTPAGTTRITVTLPTTREPAARPVDYGRAGQGLALAFAGTLVAAHGGTLEQLDESGTLAGFRMELPAT
ncbi:MAG: histidine kinase dimerization/phospho-acceptor domain-containing protein [Vicinamibacterales bacterium]